MKRIIAIVILLLTILMLSACNADVRYITWDFNHGDVEPYVQKVRYGQKIQRLDRNIVDEKAQYYGYRVDKWMPENETNEQFEIKFPYVVRDSLTFQATWVLETEGKDTIYVKVEHKINNAEIELEDFTVMHPWNDIESKGEVAPRLPDTDKWKFCGWFEDLKYELGFDASAPISKDLILYAKWELKS